MPVDLKSTWQQKDLASKLVIISDMEFNTCMLNADKTNFENAKQKYERYGYKLPEICLKWLLAGIFHRISLCWMSCKAADMRKSVHRLMRFVPILSESILAVECIL